MPPWSARGPSKNKTPVLSELNAPEPPRQSTPRRRGQGTPQPQRQSTPRSARGPGAAKYTPRAGTPGPEAGKTSPSDPEKTDLGDGGMVSSRFAEAALERRGNAEMRRKLEDSTRMYCNVDQRHWEQKYKFFSARHMERSYRLFTRARHDPFNKDPSWGKSIIGRFADACSKKDVAPENLFTGVDVTGDGNLNRPEMKRVVTGVLPTLSDEEVTAIFDSIDEDKSGEVNVKEFCEVVRKGKNFKVADETAQRWRNPIHRFKRFAPAQVEGWDHLDGDVKFRQFDKLCDSVQSNIQDRMGESLAVSARGDSKNIAQSLRHTWFSGGADCDRFRKAQWAKDKVQNPEKLTPRITDPGPFPKPGWMYQTEMREFVDSHGMRFELPRKPLSAR